MESLSCELGFSITSSRSCTSSFAEQQGGKVDDLFKKLQPDFFTSTTDEVKTSSSQELEDLEDEISQIFYKQQLPASASRESLTEDLSENTAPAELAFVLKDSPPPLGPMTSILKKSEGEKPKASPLHNLKAKIKTRFKRNKNKGVIIRKMSLDNVEKQRLQTMIHPKQLWNIDENLTQNLHIFLILENDQTVQLSFEPLDQYRVAGTAAGLTKDEQDILLLHAEPQRALKEAYEKSRATYEALELSRKKRVQSRLFSSKQMLAEAEELGWISDDYIPNASLEDLEITKTPFIYIEIVHRTESIMLKYECELCTKSNPQKYQFTKIYTFSRFKEGPELMTSTYKLNRV